MSSQTRLRLICAIVALWVSFIAWLIAWPLTWASAPILLCCAYIVLRLVYELTLNKDNVPTLATAYLARRRAIEALGEHLPKNKKYYKISDLGSGRGEFARQVAKAFPDATVTGIENARIPHLQSKWMQRIIGPKNLSFIYGDLNKYDLSELDAALLYLGPLSTAKVGKLLDKKMKKGSLVITQNYPMLAPWETIDTITTYTPFKETIFVYKKK